MAMFDNGTFIQQQLVNVHLDELTQKSLEDICSKLIGTRYEVMDEIDELNDLLTDKNADKRMVTVLNRIIPWFYDDLMELHRIVKTLEVSSENDAKFSSAYILVTESAMNILKTFNEAKIAADRLLSCHH